MAKEIIKTRTSKNAETLGALYIYIYISILLQTSGIGLLDHTHFLQKCAICYAGNAKLEAIYSVT